MFGAAATVIIQAALLFILAAVFVGRDEAHGMVEQQDLEELREETD